MFSYFLLDYIKKYIETTSAHSKHIMGMLHNNIIHIDVLSNTDAQLHYIYHNFSRAYKIVIDSSGGAPVHGKDIVYGFKAT